MALEPHVEMGIDEQSAEVASSSRSAVANFALACVVPFAVAIGCALLAWVLYSIWRPAGHLVSAAAIPVSIIIGTVFARRAAPRHPMIATLLYVPLMTFILTYIVLWIALGLLMSRA